MFRSKEICQCLPENINYSNGEIPSLKGGNMNIDFIPATWDEQNQSKEVNMFLDGHMLTSTDPNKTLQTHGTIITSLMY